MHLILYGSEGSGKGTQAKLLSKLLGLPIYNAGDLVREAATKDEGPIGDVCREALSFGEYLSDSDIFLLFGKKLKSTQAKKGFILDGFPRTLAQAKFLLKKTAKYGYKIDKLIYLKISDKEAFVRLSKRKRKLYHGSQVSHDTPERIRRRLNMYHKQEGPLLNFFRKKNLLLEINATKPIKGVFAALVKRLQIADS